MDTDAILPSNGDNDVDNAVDIFATPPSDVDSDDLNKQQLGLTLYSTTQSHKAKVKKASTRSSYSVTAHWREHVTHFKALQANTQLWCQNATHSLSDLPEGILDPLMYAFHETETVACAPCTVNEALTKLKESCASFVNKSKEAQLLAKKELNKATRIIVEAEKELTNSEKKMPSNGHSRQNKVLSHGHSDNQVLKLQIALAATKAEHKAKLAAINAEHKPSWQPTTLNTKPRWQPPTLSMWPTKPALCSCRLSTSMQVTARSNWP